MTSKTMRIELASLNRELQTRAGTDEATAQEYAERMSDGEKFPPVTVFIIDGVYHLADGFHRVRAAELNGKRSITAEVREGTVEDAIIYGGTANNKQGKRPTREDAQHFMRMVWERRETIFGGTPTGGNFATRCGVSRRTGERFVAEREAEMQPTESTSNASMTHFSPPVRIAADGRKYPVRPMRPVKPSTPIAPVTMPVRPSIVPGEDAQDGAPVVASSAPVMQAETAHPTTNDGKHAVPLDRFGVEIPPSIIPSFAERSKLDETIKTASALRVMLRNALAEAAPAFAAVRQDALIELDNAYNYLKAAKPFCVCRLCQGNGCNACHNRGWQTVDEYERNPNEFKANPTK